VSGATDTGAPLGAGAAAPAAEPRHPLDRIEARCARVARPIAFIGVLGMLIVAGVTLIDILGRWFFNSPIPALNEVVAEVFAVGVAACIPSGFAQSVNLTVDILARWITGRLAAWLSASGAVLLLVFVGLLTWRIEIFAQSLEAQHRTTVILRWPEAPFMHAVAVLLAAGAVVQAVVALNAVRRAATLRPATPAALSARLVVGCVVAVALAIAIYALTDLDGLSEIAQHNPELSVLVAFLFLWAFLLGLMPLAAVMAMMGLFGAALFIGFGPSLGAFGTEPAGFLTNSQVAVLPLFLMMGSFAATAGLSDDIYALAHALFGGFRGGLALATIGGCAGFGAVTGSSIACAATIGRVALPEMRARGYAPHLTTGCIAAGGTLGQLVPPSAPIVIFALLTEASIGQLFIAAVGPAVLAVVFYLATIALFVRFAPGTVPDRSRIAFAELVAAVRRSLGVLVLFVCVIGGLYTGVFTATESAAVGAFATFLFALFRGRLHGGAFWRVMAETTATTALIYGLIFGALIFSFFVGATALPETATRLVGGLSLSPLGVIAVLLVFYLLLGCVMDSFAVMVITVPIVTPLVTHLGFDLIWWGIIMVVVIETGLITPPFGLNVFVLKSMVPDVPLGTIFRGVVPFVAADLLKLILLVLFPAIVLWLPSTMH
jgi:tripartite ATP-independent transporter DctM subunit